MSEHVSGQRIVKELGGFWKAGKGMCRCPAHQDRSPSLSVREAQDRVLLHCFTGCTFEQIVAALRGLGLWPERDEHGYRIRRSMTRSAPPPDELDADEISARRAAREIWSRAVPISGTGAAVYLWSRGIGISHLPPTLRFADELYNSETKRALPALVGALQDSENRVTSIQRIWVRDRIVVDDDGMPAKGTKAALRVAKKTLGPMRDGAIRLGRPGRTLGIAEGIETGLSAQQYFRLPVWVSCGAWRMGNIWLPDIVEHVILFGDNGTEGEKAANKAAEQFEAQGYAVSVEMPPAEFDDWNSFQAADRPGRAV